MDPPASGDEVKPENLEEAKEGGPLFHCELFDSEVVHKIAQALLPGLASACVDNTTGDLLRSAASVAVDIRREMVDYLLQRSENFVAESVVLEGGPDADVSDDPFDIVSDFIDDFATSKRNFLSRVSGWLLSERREDRIDDFVQEMELDGFWLIGRREAVSQSLLKNVDFKNAFHCSVKFKEPEELDEHRLHCNFRTINCENEGCNSRFSAAHLELHDSTCPFKILPCEQNCSASIMRREMDRHCITVCPMKLANCPFYTVGCQSTIPQCKLNEHRSDNLQSHLLNVLQIIHKEVPTDDLKKRIEQVEKLSSHEQLSACRDARALAYIVKDLEAKLGPLEFTKIETNPSEEDRESMDKKESSSSSTSSEECKESPSKNEQVVKSTTEDDDNMVISRGNEDVVESLSSLNPSEIPEEKEKCKDSPSSKEESDASVSEQEDLTDSPVQKKELPGSTMEYQKQIELPIEEEHVESISEKDECPSPVKRVKPVESQPSKEESEASLSEQEDLTDSPVQKKELPESTMEDQMKIEFPTEEEQVESTSEADECRSPVKGVKPVESSSSKEGSEASLSEQEDLTDSPVQKKEHLESIKEDQMKIEFPTEEEHVKSTSETDECRSPVKEVKPAESSSSKEGSEASLSEQEDLTDSPVQELSESTMEDQKQIESPTKEEHIEPKSEKDEWPSPVKSVKQVESPEKTEASAESPSKE